MHSTAQCVLLHIYLPSRSLWNRLSGLVPGLCPAVDAAVFNLDARIGRIPISLYFMLLLCQLVSVLVHYCQALLYFQATYISSGYGWALFIVLLKKSDAEVWCCGNAFSLLLCSFSGGAVGRLSDSFFLHQVEIPLSGLRCHNWRSYRVLRPLAQL